MNIMWRKSSRSASNGGQCVEVGPLTDHSGRIAVRDTKHRQGPVLVYDRSTWSGFVTELQSSGSAIIPS